MVEKHVLLCFVKIVNFSGVHLALSTKNTQLPGRLHTYNCKDSHTLHNKNGSKSNTNSQLQSQFSQRI